MSLKGYGFFQERSGVSVSPAHRVAWELANQRAIPNGMHVLHRCDNRACVRPDHLFLGTQRDNTLDMLAKGREARGERIGIAKLKSDDVIRIRTIYAAGLLSSTMLGRQFGVSGGTILDVIHRRTWTHIP